MTSTPTISINSPPTSSRPSIDSSNAHSRLSSDSLQSLASLPSQAGTPGGTATRQHASAQRRNRSALREFYGLKRKEEDAHPMNLAASAPSSSVGLGVEMPDTMENQMAFLTAELDASDFDAQSYVDRLVATQDLRGLLRMENGLVNDIRGLDGERKSLVYDNYNKLIAATDTIRSMRSNMEPLAPTTTTLSPAISHIASVSASLVENVHAHDPKPNLSVTPKLVLKKKQDAVRFILAAPDRVRVLVHQGRKEDAILEWQKAKESSSKWKNVEAFDMEEFLNRGETALTGK